MRCAVPRSTAATICPSTDFHAVLRRVLPRFRVLPLGSRDAKGLTAQHLMPRAQLLHYGDRTANPRLDGI